MPRRKQSTQKYSASTDPGYEERLQQAMFDITNGVYKSYAKAALVNNVSNTTLWDRANAKHMSHKSHATSSKRVLNDTQEETLVEWVRLQSISGTPWTWKDLVAQAAAISGRTAPLKQWAKTFLKRHQGKLKSHKARHLDPKRAQNFNKTTVAGFYGLLLKLQEDYGPIPPEHIWNMDEKGIQMGGGRKDADGANYLFSIESKDYYREHNDDLELVTVLECANAAGTMLKPYFVLKEGPLPDPTEDPRLNNASGIGKSPNGWTDDEVFVHWFRVRRIENSVYTFWNFRPRFYRCGTDR